METSRFLYELWYDLQAYLDSLKRCQTENLYQGD